MQSRYYDPETGRFINCDDVDYIGISDTFTGWNGFAYCENEPVNDTDPTGKWVLSVGIEAMAAFVLGVYFGLGIAVDSYKNLLITFTTGLAIITNASAFVGVYIQRYFQYNTVRDLKGWCVSVGASYSMGLSTGISGAVDIGTNNFSTALSVSLGAGVSAYPIPYFQTKATYTFEVFSTNINTINRRWEKNKTVKKSLKWATIAIKKKASYVEISCSKIKKKVKIYYTSGKVSIK